MSSGPFGRRRELRRALAILVVTALVSCKAASDRADDASLGAAFTGERIDEPTVKVLSHGMLDAYDRGDVNAVAQALGPSCDMFNERELSDRNALMDKIRARHDRHAPAHSRTYGQERVFVSGSSSVFIGRAVEHYPPDGIYPNGDFDGWTTLVWVREGKSWKVAHWQWTREVSSREQWNATYLEGRAVNPQPSQLLAEVVRGRRPGKALDVAMGQGRNSLYLASQGWEVTGIDISDVGVRMARLAAAERRLRIEAINADETTWDYGTEKWDLVALFYTCCDGKMVEKVKRSLKRGGFVVVEGFHKDAGFDAFVPPDQLSALKSGLNLVRDEVVEDFSDWGPRGARVKLVRFVAQKP
jgi:SAM-dependent methyltransferase